MQVAVFGPSREEVTGHGRNVITEEFLNFWTYGLHEGDEKYIQNLSPRIRRTKNRRILRKGVV
jgi:hypothetical protein